MKHHQATIWVTAHLLDGKKCLYLKEIFDKKSIEDLIDKTTLQTTSRNTKVFNECFHSGLPTLKKHDSIVKEQSKFCSKKKSYFGSCENPRYGWFCWKLFILQDAA